MNELRRQALEICVILIATGVFMRIVPDKSDKRGLRFIVTLILITSVFKLEIPLSDISFEFDTLSNNSEEVSEYENALKSTVKDSLFAQLESYISDEYRKYDADITVKVEPSEDKLTVNVFSGTRLSGFEREKIQSRLESDIDTELEFIYRE